MSEINRDHIALQGSPRKMAFEILREWCNCVSQRETGQEKREKEFGKCSTRCTHMERTCIVKFSAHPLQTKANFIHACRSGRTLLSTTKIRFFRKSTWVTIFFPHLSFSLSLSLFLRGWESCFGRESEFPSTRLEIDYGIVFLLLEFSGDSEIILFYFRIFYFIEKYRIIYIYIINLR